MRVPLSLIGCVVIGLSFGVAGPGVAADCRVGACQRLVHDVWVESFADADEAERIIALARAVPMKRRIPLISRWFLGRPYPARVRERVRRQHARPRTRVEATNEHPLPVVTLPTSLRRLDCMTYVEHVLALAAADRPDYEGAFLPSLVDVMYDANGAALFNHLRNHFVSQWADINERKGYLVNIARRHPEAARRFTLLNRVGGNRTFFIEDRFLISRTPQVIHYFPNEMVTSRRAPLQNGDIVAMVVARDGLDVVHMGFFIERGNRWLLRHASSRQNRVVEEDLAVYLKGRPAVIGLMVLRPRLSAPPPPRYRFHARDRLPQVVESP